MEKIYTLIKPGISGKDSDNLVYKPKHSLKQKVYFMENNKVVSDIIWFIKCPQIWINNKGFIEMTYTGYHTKNRKNVEYREHELFKTKQELLKSL